MLSIRNLGKTYSRSGKIVNALNDIALEVKSGEFVVVRGPSGCGKTTLLLAAGALLAPSRGTVEIDGVNPYALPAEKRAKWRGGALGFVFQQFHLIPYLTALENVMAPSLAVPGNETSQRAQSLLERFNLADRADHVPSELSMGERQRTALARALLNNPKLLLADEPTGNLDPDNAAVVLRHIAEFAKSGGAALMVTHAETAQEYASRIVWLRDGRLVNS
jgi:putative ABC transport system ATP-binding protein